MITVPVRACRINHKVLYLAEGLQDYLRFATCKSAAFGEFSNF